MCFPVRFVLYSDLYRAYGFEDMNKEALTTILALLIALVWAVVAIASVITQEYNSLAIITPVMLIVAGFLFGYKRNGNS